MPLGELENEAVGKILIVGETGIRNGLKDQTRRPIRSSSTSRTAGSRPAFRPNRCTPTAS